MSIRRVRAAPGVQALLYLAVFMSLAGALGLHPEPDLVAGSGASQPAWASAQAHAASNDCPICLSHRSVWLAGLSGVVLQPGANRADPALLKLLPPGLPTPLRYQGRAPPSA